MINLSTEVLLIPHNYVAITNMARNEKQLIQLAFKQVFVSFSENSNNDLYSNCK